MFVKYYNLLILSYLTTIQSLPFTIDGSLKEITIHNLTDYEASQERFPSVEDFYISFSCDSITYIPNHVFGYTSTKNLIGIDLSSKSIKFIDDEAFSLLNHLQYLDLSKNDITEFNQNTFLGLENLKTLNISKNNVTYLNDNVFANLRSIKILDISHNNILELYTASFSHISTLKRLVLSHNKIKRLWHPYFSELKNLEELYLKKNKVAMFPISILEKNIALKTLDLSSNGLVHLLISKNSSVLSSIKYFNLSNNYLINLDVKSIKNHFPNNDLIIDFNDNQFYCTCWKQYSENLKEKKIKITPGRNFNETYYVEGIACDTLNITLRKYDPDFKENQVISCDPPKYPSCRCGV